MNTLDITKADVGVASDLYHAGTADDGHPFLAEVYFVYVSFIDGEQWRHGTRFPGCEAGHCEETGEPYFLDRRECAKAVAERLAARVRAAGRIDIRLWDEDEPAYGSPVYIARGVEAERAYQDRFDA